MLPPATNDYSSIEAQKALFSGPFNKTASILIPFYKNLQILNLTLASLVCQDYPPHLWNIIISGDGTDEPVKDIISLYNSKLDINFINHERRGYRLNATRNHGIMASDKDVIVLIDFDMICPSHFLKAHLSWFHVSDHISTFGLRRFIDTSLIRAEDLRNGAIDLYSVPEVYSISNTNSISVKDKRIPEVAFIKSHPFPCNVFHGCNVVFRRQDAIQVGLFDETMTDYEDLEFGHRLWKSGIFIAHEPDALAFHQENEVINLAMRRELAELNRKVYFERVPGVQQFRESLPYLANT